MASSQPDQQQQHPLTTAALIGAGGLVAVDRIRALYLAAETRALQALRKAVARVLRAPERDLSARFDSKWRLDRELVGLVNQLADVAPAEIKNVVDTARDAGIHAAEHDLGPRTDVLRQPADQPIPAVTIDHSRIVTVVDETYRRIIEKAVAAETGRINRQRVAQRALDEYAARGVSVFIDRAGRAWSIGAYVEMAVRSAASTAQIDAYVARAQAAGASFLQVSSSDTCCPLCMPYDGKIIAVDSLGEARAAGLFHFNCKHRVTLVKRNAPPITRPAPDPALYEAQQRLRYLERRVRAAKRKLDVALDPAAQRKARAEVNAAFAAIRDHIDQTGVKRQRAREQTNQARG